ncbi:MAG TPA: alpha/beta hydrolase [Rhodospirillales bacterium]|nr:alpha/beta hydrolase [Rhodospirillales bacterium]
MIRIVIAAATAYATLAGGVYLFQRFLLYRPENRLPSPGQSGVGDMKPVPLQTEDGLTLKAWYKAPEPAQSSIVYFHGNAGNIAMRAAKARLFLDKGFGLLLVEYRGFGGNPGRPSEDGLFSDGRAARAFLLKEGVSPSQTVLYGESLGSGVAVRMAYEMAKEGPASALVLEAPFSSIAALAAHHYPYLPARFLIKDRFDNRSLIGHVKTRLLVVHGENDRTTPVSFARELFEAAVFPKRAYWLAGAGHGDLYENGAGEIVLKFLNDEDQVAGGGP